MKSKQKNDNKRTRGFEIVNGGGLCCCGGGGRCGHRHASFDSLNEIKQKKNDNDNNSIYETKIIENLRISNFTSTNNITNSYEIMKQTNQAPVAAFTTRLGSFKRGGPFTALPWPGE